jgi:hypothetical protein
MDRIGHPARTTAIVSPCAADLDLETGNSYPRHHRNSDRFRIRGTSTRYPRGRVRGARATYVENYLTLKQCGYKLLHARIGGSGCNFD